MKRISLVCLIVFVLLCGLASAETDAGAKALMADKSGELTALMAACAESDSYIRLYTSGNTELAETIRKIGGAGWSVRRSGTVFELKEGAIDVYLRASGLSLNNFDGAVAEKVRQGVLVSFPQALVAQYDISALSVASVLRCGTVFIADDAFPEAALVLLRYNDSYDTICSFVKTEGNIVSASLLPVPAGSEEHLRQIMSMYSYLPNKVYEEYPIE